MAQGVSVRLASVRPQAHLLLWPALATFVAGAILILLGVWQLQRLAWKEALIAQVAARVTAEPAPLPPEESWPTLAPQDYAYRHVRFPATFVAGADALVFRPAGGALRQPGFLALTPARLPSGAFVIVNRGFVPASARDAVAAPPGGMVEISGLMREPEPRNLFTPPDRPETDAYFTRDPALIAARFGLARAAPFTIDADRSLSAGSLGTPEGGASELAFPNNHLAYALTWFGLAAALTGVFVAFAWRRLREGDPPIR